MVAELNSPARPELARPVCSRPILQTPYEALSDYITQVSQSSAGDLVWAKTMNFTTDGIYTGPLVAAWFDARERGVDVQVQADSHARRVVYDRVDLYRDNGYKRGSYKPDDYSFYRNKAFQLLEEMRAMEEAGILTFTRPYDERVHPVLSRFPLAFIPPFYRCDHSKQWGIIGKNTSSAWIGGVNLFDDGLRYTDAMVRIQDPYMVEMMHNIFNRFNGSDAYDEQHVFNDGELELLVDAGEKPWRSVIYRRFFEEVGRDQIGSIDITTQFPLDPLVMLALGRAARRGTKVRIAYSQPGEFFKGIGGKTLYEFNKLIASQSPDMELAHHTKYLHAKVLNVTRNDGVTTSMIGSHNYTAIGVVCTTREMQLVSHDQQLNQQLAGFFNSVWAESTPLKGQP